MHANFAATGDDQSAQRVGKLGLSVAGYAGDAEDLAARNAEVCAFQLVPGGQVGHL